MSLKGRLIAIALLVPMSGCIHTWEQVQPISPSELGAEARVRLTVESDSTVVLHDPIVGQDSISGTVEVDGCGPTSPDSSLWTCAKRNTTITYELSTLSKIETRQPNAGQTFALWVTVPAVVGAIWFAKVFNESCLGPFECK